MPKLTQMAQAMENSVSRGSLRTVGFLRPERARPLWGCGGRVPRVWSLRQGWGPSEVRARLMFCWWCSSSNCVTGQHPQNCRGAPHLLIPASWDERLPLVAGSGPMSMRSAAVSASLGAWGEERGHCHLPACSLGPLCLKLGHLPKELSSTRARAART